MADRELLNPQDREHRVFAKMKLGFMFYYGKFGVKADKQAGLGWILSAARDGSKEARDLAKKWTSD